MGLVVFAALQLVVAEISPTTAQETQRPSPVVEGPHVRGVDPAIQRLVARGQARSATFRRIVAELDASDVVVHLIQGPMPDGFRGYLIHRVVESNGVRYLKIAVDPRAAEALVIGLIAHELQHALEVARAPEVGRSRDIEEFFRSIADQGCRNARCFETSAAVEVQETVTRELD